MLRENKNIKQYKGEKARKWFEDEYFDLIVWYDAVGEIYGFQLCYNKEEDEHVLTWQKDTGFAHNRIDTGEESPFRNLSPILVPDGIFPHGCVIKKFRERSGGIEQRIAEFVIDKLASCNKGL